MDVILLGIIAGFIAGGWRTGFLRRLVGLGYAAVAIVAGAYLRYAVGGLISTVFSQVPRDYADMVGYLVSVTILIAGLNLISHRVLGKVAVSGVSRVTDQALGAALGGAEAILLISVLIVVLDTYFGHGVKATQFTGLGLLYQLDQALDASTTAQLLRQTTVPFVLAVLGPLLPKDVTTLLPTVPVGLPIPSGFPLPTVKP